MRYVLMGLGGIGLVMGFLMFAKENTPLATLVIQLGGVFLAVGMATTDVVEAIKGSSRRG
jgi:hypothetical protein